MLLSSFKTSLESSPAHDRERRREINTKNTIAAFTFSLAAILSFSVFFFRRRKLCGDFPDFLEISCEQLSTRNFYKCFCDDAKQIFLDLKIQI
jgi:hypothetical protein